MPSGQRELDSDEFDDEVNETPNVVQPGWKVSDAPADKGRAGWNEQGSIQIEKQEPAQTLIQKQASASGEDRT